MKTNTVSEYPRYAGEVVRYHCWPTSVRQTTGQHTWQVMRIYTQIFGMMSPEVSYYILHHDSGELNTGDLAHHVKARRPDLKHLMDEAETEGLDMIGIVLPELPAAEKLRVKACDLLEMAEFAVEEQLRGNMLARAVTINIEWALCNHVKKMDERDQTIVEDFVHELNNRSRNVGRGMVTLTSLDGEDRR